MSSANYQLVKINGKDIFLVLTERTGADFTFYLRNDDKEAQLIRRVLRDASDETTAATSAQSAAPTQLSEVEKSEAKKRTAADTPPDSAEPEPANLKATKQKLKYACRVNILEPLLEPRDLQAQAVDILRKLRACHTGLSKAEPYLSLINNLPKTRMGLSGKKLNHEALLKTLTTELNDLLKKVMPASLRNIPLNPSDEEQQLLKDLTDRAARKRIRNYVYLRAHLNVIKPLETRIKVGRVLAALSYEGKVWTLSFREQEVGSGYKPSAKLHDNLNSIEEICQSLYEEIFQVVSACEVAEEQEEKRSRAGQTVVAQKKKKLAELSGLVVIAGSTNSAKSLITRGLIYRYLESVKSSDPRRRPHLVTFEDPIERYFAEESYQPTAAHPQRDIFMDAMAKKVDYTPRQREVDVEDLAEALQDALRQTPKVFFVGETRNSQDWKALIDFAATGHLLITTAHAGSLVEAMHKIFLATKAKTSAERGEVAGRLLAIVHLKRVELSEPATSGAYRYNYNVLVPALWRRLPKGLNGLIAEGLASVLPHSYSDTGDPCSCLGRKYFAYHLLKQAEQRQTPLPQFWPRFKQNLGLKATDWDLQGA